MRCFLMTLGLLIPFSALFWSCGLPDPTPSKKNVTKNSDTTSNNTDSLSDIIFSARINGEKFNSEESESGAELLLTSDSSNYNLTILAYDELSGDITGNVLVGLSITGNNFESLKDGVHFDETSFTKDSTRSLASFLYNNNIFDLFGSPNPQKNDVINVKITKIEKGNQLISGEFNFEYYDTKQEKIFEITEGQFTDLKYELANN